MSKNVKDIATSAAKGALSCNSIRQLSVEAAVKAAETLGLSAPTHVIPTGDIRNTVMRVGTRGIKELLEHGLIREEDVERVKTHGIRWVEGGVEIAGPSDTSQESS